MFSQKKSAGWAEIAYINSFSDKNLFTKREYLLAWVFSTIQKQHGFAFMLAQKAQQLFTDLLFKELEKHSENKIKLNIIFLRFFPAVIIKIKQWF